MTTTYYLIDNEHLDTIKAMMHVPEGKDFLLWLEGNGDEDAMDALLNKAVPTTTDQDILVNPLVIPEGKFVVGIGVSWFNQDGTFTAQESDLFPEHVSEYSSLISLLCLRRDMADSLIPKDCRVKNICSTGIMLDSHSGYTAMRIYGMYA